MVAMVHNDRFSHPPLAAFEAHRKDDNEDDDERHVDQRLSGAKEMCEVEVVGGTKGTAGGQHEGMRGIPFGAWSRECGVY